MAALLLIVCASICVPAAGALVADPDSWWVAAAGRQMLRSGQLPVQNMFSFVEPSRAWVMHEWLFAVPYAVGLEKLGPRFFSALGAVSALATCALILRATVLSSRYSLVGLASAVLALGIFCGHVGSSRPTSVALLFPLLMQRCLSARNFGQRHIAAVALLQLVWVNAHGSFPLGLMMLGASWTFATEQRRLRGVAMVAAGLATLCTPYGISLYRLVFDYARGSAGAMSVMQQFVYEFAPVWKPPFHVVVPWEALVGLAPLAWVALQALRRPEHRGQGALVCVLIVQGLLHARHVRLAGTLAICMLLPVIDELFERSARGSQRFEIHRRPAVLAALLLSSIGALGCWLAWSSRRGDFEWVAPQSGGQSFKRLASMLPDGAHAYTLFQTSGELIWLGYLRDVRVFYDSRNDCYSPAHQYRAFNLLNESSERIEDIFQQTNTNYALVPTAAYVAQSGEFNATWKKQGRVAEVLSASPAWKQVQTDGGWALYQRTH